MSRRVLVWLSMSLLMLVVVGCGGSASPVTPAPSLGATGSPMGSLDPADVGVCEATLTMEHGLERVAAVKLRGGARGRLDQALQSVLTGNDALLQRAPYTMRTRLRTFGLVVTNLTLAVEDFRTTNRIDIAATNVRKATAQLAKAIDSFQRWLGCDAIVMPTPPPDASPSPSLVPYASDPPSVEG